MKNIALLSAALLLTACAAEPGHYGSKIQTNDLTDLDQDGVINARDMCADTPLRVVTDNDGCPIEKQVIQERGVVIEFGYDEYTLTDSAKEVVLEFAKSIADEPSLAVLLIGDTSNKGSLNYNRKLALKRIEAVKAALLEHNINESQISGQTFIDTKKIPQKLKGRKTRVIALVEDKKSTILEKKFDVYSSGL